jgi:hypothetical protein
MARSTGEREREEESKVTHSSSYHEVLAVVPRRRLATSNAIPRPNQRIGPEVAGARSILQVQLGRPPVSLLLLLGGG